MRKKYTDEELLEKLKIWANIHKKSPSARNILKDKSMPSLYTYVNRFGTFNKAKKLAGLEVSGYTKEELIQKLVEWANIHKKSPTIRDIYNDKSMPSTLTYIDHFGSFNKAKELVGLEVNKYRKEVTYTKEELIQKLAEWANIHKKSPSARNILKDKSMPSLLTYVNHFGTFNKAKKLAGLEIFEHDSELNYVKGLLRGWKEERTDELSDTTVESYLRILLDLKKFLEKNGKKMEEMTFQDIKSYIFEIKNFYAKKTMSLIFIAIKNFLDFILHKAIIEKRDPQIDESTIERVKVFFKKQCIQMEYDSEETPALSEEEVEIIKEKLRNYPLFDNLFRLDLNLGLRASEFLKIKVSEGTILNRKQARKGDVWIDLSRGILMIYRRKTKRPHLVALTSDMIELVKKQLTLRKRYCVQHEFLFFSKTGKPLRRDRVIDYYREISEIVGFKITSHKVRRTMSTMLEKRRVPHSIIRIRMGHGPMDGTQLYQRYPIRERQKILAERVGVL